MVIFEVTKSGYLLLCGITAIAIDLVLAMGCTQAIAVYTIYTYATFPVWLTLYNFGPGNESQTATNVVVVVVVVLLLLGPLVIIRFSNP